MRPHRPLASLLRVFGSPASAALPSTLEAPHRLVSALRADFRTRGASTACQVAFEATRVCERSSASTIASECDTYGAAVASAAARGASYSEQSCSEASREPASQCRRGAAESAESAEKTRGWTVAVEGNIGVGKSTVLSALGARLNSDVALRRAVTGGADVALQPEPLREWRNVRGSGENALDAFYKDPKRFAYTFQSLVFISRASQYRHGLQQHPSALRLCERSLFCDRLVFAPAAVAGGLFTPLEEALYDSWVDAVLPMLPGVVPDAFIYLRADPSVCLQRLKQRSRSEETSVDLPYLQRLHELYDRWFLEGSHRTDPEHAAAPSFRATLDGALTHSALDGVPGLVVDCNQHIQQCDGDIVEPRGDMGEGGERLGKGAIMGSGSGVAEALPGAKSRAPFLSPPPFPSSPHPRSSTLETAMGSAKRLKPRMWKSAPLSQVQQIPTPSSLSPMPDGAREAAEAAHVEERVRRGGASGAHASSAEGDPRRGKGKFLPGSLIQSTFNPVSYVYLLPPPRPPSSPAPLSPSSLHVQGVDKSIRGEVWEFLLGCFSLESTAEERNYVREARRERYQQLLLQCQQMHINVGSGQWTLPVFPFYPHIFLSPLHPTPPPCRERYQQLLLQCQQMHSNVGSGHLAFAVGTRIMDVRIIHPGNTPGNSGTTPGSSTANVPSPATTSPSGEAGGGGGGGRAGGGSSSRSNTPPDRSVLGGAGARSSASGGSSDLRYPPSRQYSERGSAGSSTQLRLDQLIEEGGPRLSSFSSFSFSCDVDIFDLDDPRGLFVRPGGEEEDEEDLEEEWEGEGMEEMRAKWARERQRRVDNLDKLRAQDALPGGGAGGAGVGVAGGASSGVAGVGAGTRAMGKAEAGAPGIAASAGEGPGGEDADGAAAGGLAAAAVAAAAAAAGGGGGAGAGGGARAGAHGEEDAPTGAQGARSGAGGQETGRRPGEGGERGEDQSGEGVRNRRRAENRSFSRSMSAQPERIGRRERREAEGEESGQSGRGWFGDGMMEGSRESEGGEEGGGGQWDGGRGGARGGGRSASSRKCGSSGGAFSASGFSTSSSHPSAGTALHHRAPVQDHYRSSESQKQQYSDVPLAKSFSSSLPAVGGEGDVGSPMHAVSGADRWHAVSGGVGGGGGGMGQGGEGGEDEGVEEGAGEGGWEGREGGAGGATDGGAGGRRLGKEGRPPAGELGGVGAAQGAHKGGGEGGAGAAWVRGMKKAHKKLIGYLGASDSFGGREGVGAGGGVGVGTGGGGQGDGGGGGVLGGGKVVGKLGGEGHEGGVLGGGGGGAGGGRAGARRRLRKVLSADWGSTSLDELLGGKGLAASASTNLSSSSSQPTRPSTAAGSTAGNAGGNAAGNAAGLASSGITAPSPEPVAGAVAGPVAGALAGPVAGSMEGGEVWGMVRSGSQGLGQHGRESALGSRERMSFGGGGDIVDGRERDKGREGEGEREGEREGKDERDVWEALQARSSLSGGTAASGAAGGDGPAAAGAVSVGVSGVDDFTAGAAGGERESAEDADPAPIAAGCAIGRSVGGRGAPGEASLRVWYSGGEGRAEGRGAERAPDGAGRLEGVREGRVGEDRGAGAVVGPSPLPATAAVADAAAGAGVLGGVGAAGTAERVGTDARGAVGGTEQEQSREEVEGPSTPKGMGEGRATARAGKSRVTAQRGASRGEESGGVSGEKGDGEGQGSMEQGAGAAGAGGAGGAGGGGGEGGAGIGVEESVLEGIHTSASTGGGSQAAEQRQSILQAYMQRKSFNGKNPTAEQEEEGKGGEGAEGGEEEGGQKAQLTVDPVVAARLGVTVERVADWLWTLHKISVDVERTDTHMAFYQAERNRATMCDILAVHAWIDPATGFCQGMCDILSPFIMLYAHPADAFWCFECLFSRIRHNFVLEGPVGILRQLAVLRDVVALVDPELASHLEELGADNFMFAFRMLLVLFRRELPLVDVIVMWEMMWAADFDSRMASVLLHHPPEGLNLVAEPHTWSTGPLPPLDSPTNDAATTPVPFSTASNQGSGSSLGGFDVMGLGGGRRGGIWRSGQLTAQDVEGGASLMSQWGEARVGDEDLAVFCVAAILRVNRKRLLLVEGSDEAIKWGEAWVGDEDLAMFGVAAILRVNRKRLLVVEGSDEAIKVGLAF
ncbi:unnamed protein product [Closterium sp. NIES-64]|nr:unnamed protein product [Closterium sp. NIES-64]